MRHLILIATFLLTSTISYADRIVSANYYENGNVKQSLEVFNEGTEFSYFTYSEYYESGNIKESGEYNSQLIRTGTWTAYCEEGKVVRTVFYSNGMRHGTHRVYNSEGKVTVEANYRYGMKHGVFKVYDDSGEILLAQRVYKRNKLKEKFEWKEDRGLLIVNL